VTDTPLPAGERQQSEIPGLSRLVLAACEKHKYTRMRKLLLSLLFIEDNKSGLTPLMLPAQKPGGESVKALLANGADLTARSAAGLTALNYASMACNRDAVVALLDWARMKEDAEWARTSS